MRARSLAVAALALAALVLSACGESVSDEYERESEPYTVEEVPEGQIPRVTLVPSAVTLAAMAGSVILLGLALKSLPVGTAYAVWTGIGAVGTATLGIFLFGEPATALRLASIGLIVAGIVGLKLVT